jgi:hypothetical protein
MPQPGGSAPRAPERRQSAFVVTNSLQKTEESASEARARAHSSHTPTPDDAEEDDNGTVDADAGASDDDQDDLTWGEEPEDETFSQPNYAAGKVSVPFTRARAPTAECYYDDITELAATRESECEREQLGLAARHSQQNPLLGPSQHFERRNVAGIQSASSLKARSGAGEDFGYGDVEEFHAEATEEHARASLSARSNPLYANSELQRRTSTRSSQASGNSRARKPDADDSDFGLSEQDTVHAQQNPLIGGKPRFERRSGTGRKGALPQEAQAESGDDFGYEEVDEFQADAREEHTDDRSNPFYANSELQQRTSRRAGRSQAAGTKKTEKDGDDEDGFGLSDQGTLHTQQNPLLGSKQRFRQRSAVGKGALPQNAHTESGVDFEYDDVEEFHAEATEEHARTTLSARSNPLYANSGIQRRTSARAANGSSRATEQSDEDSSDGDSLRLSERSTLNTQKNPLQGGQHRVERRGDAGGSSQHSQIEDEDDFGLEDDFGFGNVKFQANDTEEHLQTDFSSRSDPVSADFGGETRAHTYKRTESVSANPPCFKRSSHLPSTSIRLGQRTHIRNRCSLRFVDFFSTCRFAYLARNRHAGAKEI